MEHGERGWPLPERSWPAAEEPLYQQSWHLDPYHGQPNPTENYQQPPSPPRSQRSPERSGAGYVYEVGLAAYGRGGQRGGDLSRASTTYSSVPSYGNLPRRYQNREEYQDQYSPSQPQLTFDPTYHDLHSTYPSQSRYNQSALYPNGPSSSGEGYDDPSYYSNSAPQYALPPPGPPPISSQLPDLPANDFYRQDNQYPAGLNHSASTAYRWDPPNYPPPNYPPPNFLPHDFPPPQPAMPPSTSSISLPFSTTSSSTVTNSSFQYSTPSSLPPPLPRSNLFDFSTLQPHPSPSPPSAIAYAASPYDDGPSPATSTSSTSSNSITSTAKLLNVLHDRNSFLSSPHPIPFNPVKLDSRQAELLTPEVTSATPFYVLQASCWNCGTSIARLNLRDLKNKGKSRADTPHRAYYTCNECANSHEEDQQDEELTGDEEKEEEPSYKDTISAAIDSLSGMSLTEKTVVRPAPIRYPVKIAEDLLVCDVCNRPLARGSVRRLGNGSSEPSSSIGASEEGLVMEAICTTCDDMYKICSDCGSGGGRLSPGRWRCKELFAAGRKNCRLNHRRHPDLTDRLYTVTPIKDIPDREAENVIADCRKMYFDTRYSALARPEILETGEGLVRSFDQVEKTTIDGWNLLSPILRKETDCPPNIIRYVGIQSIKPKHGKPVSKNEPPLGFYVGEYDLTHRVLFFGFIAPWAVLGKASDANVEMAGKVITRVREDIAKLNRNRGGSPPHLGISCLMIFVPFKADTKMGQNLMRRGYSPLQTILEVWPAAPMEGFPPHREVWIPNQFLKGFTFFIRPMLSDQDMGTTHAPPGRRKRNRKTAANLKEAANYVGRDLI